MIRLVIVVSGMRFTRMFLETNMAEWFMNLDIVVQLFLSAVIGGSAAILITLFGDIVTPDDII